MPTYAVTRTRWFRQTDTIEIETSSRAAAAVAAVHTDSEIDHEYLEEDREKHEILSVKLVTSA